MAITDWPSTERPREKLLQNGASVLTDAELLAIFLRTGVAGKSAVDLARDLLKRFGSLRALLEADKTTFCQAHGLGVAKYSQLQAIVEMSRRHLASPLQRGDVLENPTAVRNYLSSELRAYPQEVFACLFLDNKHRVIKFEILFFGTINAASVYPREVVRQALKHNAAALILSHNHPSGIAEPSDSDVEITKLLVNVMSAIDIRVLDHMIIGDLDIVSLAERGLM